MNLRALSITFILALCFVITPREVVPAGEQTLATVAEKSNFTQTSSHADVLDFCAKLAKQSPLVRLADLGETFEKRKLPLVIIADPPVATPAEAAEAAKKGRLVVFAMGNIHAGEVDGKEGLMMLMRDIALAKDRPLLKDLVMIFAPNFNADGGDKFGKNRKNQNGPPEVGLRENAQGFDLNRDFIKLETPECQALIRFFRQWDPAMAIDCHTTDGSLHRYTLTYDAPRNPATRDICNYARDILLPDVTIRLEKASGYKSFYYGNYDKGKTKWDTTEGDPRFGYHYVGFRNRLGILSESYVHAPYRDRVLASREFVKACFEFAADNKIKIRNLLADVDKQNTNPPANAQIALRHKRVPLGGKTTILILEGGKTLETGGKPKDIQVDLMYQTEATLSVTRPYAYLFPATLTKVVENLQRHGIEVEELREDIELNVQAYKVDKIDVAKAFQKHNLISLDVTARKDTRRMPAGTIVVRTNQKLGTLAAFLLEPQSADGLVTWNFFDSTTKKGEDFPVLRLPVKAAMLLTPVRPLAEDRGPKKQLTLEMLEGGKAPNLNGSPAQVMWLPDSDHFVQYKDGRAWKVHAVTGRAEPFSGSVGDYDGLDMLAPETSGPFDAAPDFGAAFQKQKGGGNLDSTAPGGKFKAILRNNNISLEEVATKKQRALTTDGSATILNGKSSWVYYEEVYDRKAGYKHYWWSPNGSHLAFVRTDEGPVPKATVIDYTAPKQLLEVTAYPRVGDPNPLVKLAIAQCAPGEGAEGQGEQGAEGQNGVAWVDFSDWADVPSFILERVGFLPDGQTLYFIIQDRYQTWLDFCTVGVKGGKPTKLFRDSTKAWIEPGLPPTFLSDGTFLIHSDRSGWKHLYHYAKDGKLLGPVTSGDWDVRSVQRVDEANQLVYFSGTKENLVNTNAYKIKLDGTGLERVTKGKGNHDVQFNPRGDMFITTYREVDTPAQVSLHRADGALVRTLDTNPVYVREEFQLGGFKRQQIPTPDGFLMEATVQKPANFDPAKKYAVWVKTYGGPAMPMIKGGGGANMGDSATANAGYIIMHIDPRSASNKGSVSAWTCYKQLGVQELADIESAVKWLTANPWADATRVGISGHSYGGFMTGFALINSKLFAAGIAGAPPTDWRNYDSIYTERYMLTPKENPQGYDKTSLVKQAKNIHGRLLLLHGLKDDNVHVQNSIQLMNSLQQANKDFDVMLYPLSRHGIGGAHYNRLMREFMDRQLKPSVQE